MLRYLTAILTLIFLASCAGSDNERSEKGSVDSISVQTGDKPVIPPAVDSFEVVYYRKPFTDSSRYYRFFTVAITNDSSVIKEVKQVLAGAYEKLPEVKKCLSEGKLIIPLGGEAYQTMYFSRLGTGCPYLYYIKDGAFYYYEMTPELHKQLNLLENQAVEPN
jgi:hypothetical protein